MKVRIIFALLAFVTTASAAQFERGSNIYLIGKYSDTLFAAGGQVHADFDSTDDVFIAARNIFYSARSTENLFIAGGNLVLQNSQARMSTMAGRSISISGADFKDLILAGGRVRIDDTRITDDVTMAGGDIIVNPNTSVGGSLTMNGGNIVFNGTASQDTVINGGNVVLAGKFLGNVRVNGESLRVAPDTIIQGNLSHAVQRLDISPTAKIQGSTLIIPPTTDTSPWSVLGIGAAILFMIGTMLVPALIVTIFPQTATNGRAEMRAYFWESLGKGAVTLILIPPVLFLLFASVIGFPIGLTALPFIAAGISLAWSISVFTVGDQLRIWLSRGEKREEDYKLSRSGRFWWTALGAFVLAMIMSIPALGFMFCFLIFAAGVGTIYAQMRGQRRVFREKPERPKIEPPEFRTEESHPSL